MNDYGNRYYGLLKQREAALLSRIKRNNAETSTLWVTCSKVRAEIREVEKTLEAESRPKRAIYEIRVIYANGGYGMWYVCHGKDKLDIETKSLDGVNVGYETRVRYVK